MGSFVMTTDVLTVSSATHMTAADLVGHSSSVLCGTWLLWLSCMTDVSLVAVLRESVGIRYISRYPA